MLQENLKLFKVFFLCTTREKGTQIIHGDIRILISMGVNITVYTGKYPETFYFTEIHEIITQTSVIFLVSQ